MSEHPALARVPNQCLPEELIDWSEYHVRTRSDGVTAEAIAAGCRAYFEAYGRALAPRPGILLHKSTANVHRLDRLLEYWPEARIVYIVRHPLGVVPALVACDLFEFKGCHGYDATVADSLLRWFNDVQAYVRSPVFGHPRVLQVRFEDMIAGPAPFFERIYRVLGLDPAARHALPGPEAYDREFVLNAEERRWIIDGTRDLVATLGYDPSAWSANVPAGEAGREQAFPERRMRGALPALDGVELERLAVGEAAARGWRRVGLFGAGYLAHLVCPHLGATARRITAIFDEHPMLVGRRLAGLPIERPERAVDLGVEAVIPVTTVHHERLRKRWALLTGGAVPTVPLVESLCPASC
jgi:hypothetical protein